MIILGQEDFIIDNKAAKKLYDVLPLITKDPVPKKCKELGILKDLDHGPFSDALNLETITRIYEMWYN